MLSIYELVARAEKLAPTIKPENRASYHELMEKLYKIKTQEDERQAVYVLASFMIAMLEAFPSVD